MRTSQGSVAHSEGTRRDRPTAVEVSLLAAGGLAGYLLSSGAETIWRISITTAAAAFSVLLAVLLRRASRRWSGSAYVLIGIVAVAIAIGFSPYLVKDSTFAMKAATLVLLAGGLLLTGWGFTRATVGVRMWRRVLVGAAVLAGTLVSVSVIAPAVAATHVPRPVIGATPASVGLAFEDVSLRTPDDVSLAAWYVPSDNGAAVVLLHGAGSTRSAVLDEATVLADVGFGVLMPDARGHGDSGGSAMDFGWAGDADLAAAIEFLETRADVEAGRIGLVGMSMGGEEAIGAAHLGVAAVVAEGATARVARDESWLSEQYGVRGAVQEQLEKAQDLVTELFTDVPRPSTLRASVGKASDTEFLLVVAGEVPDETHAAAFIRSADPSRVEVWTVDGAGHTEGLQTAPAEWESRVTGFLTDALQADQS